MIQKHLMSDRMLINPKSSDLWQWFKNFQKTVHSKSSKEKSVHTRSFRIYFFITEFSITIV